MWRFSPHPLGPSCQAQMPWLHPLLSKFCKLNHCIWIVCRCYELLNCLIWIASLVLVSEQNIFVSHWSMIPNLSTKPSNGCFNNWSYKAESRRWRLWGKCSWKWVRSSNQGGGGRDRRIPLGTLHPSLTRALLFTQMLRYALSFLKKKVSTVKWVRFWCRGGGGEEAGQGRRQSKSRPNHR